jgi:prepilin-type N-terminal cleavage/methylation domain-containing protein
MNCSSRQNALTLIEIVVSMAILAVVLVGVGGSLMTSLHATRDAKPALIAQEAGQRLIEELRNSDFSVIHQSFWNGATQKTFSGDAWTVADTLGVMQAVLDDHLVPAMDRGVMGPSSTGAAASNGDPLRLRFLTEAEFHQLWGTTLDLDYPADVTVSTTVKVGQKLYPVVVEVHYRDGTGDRVYQVGALINEEAPLDR